MLIGMNRHHNLIIREIFPRKLLRDLKGEFGSDFPWLIGNDDVVALPSVGFIEILLGVLHLAVFVTRIAVEAGGQYLSLRLVAVQDVLNRLIRSGSPAFDFRDRHAYLPIRYSSS